MTKTAGLLLVIALGLGATRDIVCQLACAEPGAAHAAAPCHESRDMSGTLLQGVQEHCTTLDLSPATTALKVGSLKDHTTVAFARVVWTGHSRTSSTVTRCELTRASCQSLPPHTLVLRI